MKWAIEHGFVPKLSSLGIGGCRHQTSEFGARGTRTKNFLSNLKVIHKVGRLLGNYLRYFDIFYYEIQTKSINFPFSLK